MVYGPGRTAATDEMETHAVNLPGLTSSAMDQGTWKWYLAQQPCCQQDNTHTISLNPAPCPTPRGPLGQRASSSGLPSDKPEEYSCRNTHSHTEWCIASCIKRPVGQTLNSKEKNKRCYLHRPSTLSPLPA